MIWLAFLAGPTAWALRELISYALVTPSCAAGSTQPLVATAAMSLALTLIGAWVGWASLRQSRADAGGHVMVRASFLATMTLGLNVLVALLIVLSSVAEFVLSPCE